MPTLVVTTGMDGYVWVNLNMPWATLVNWTGLFRQSEDSGQTYNFPWINTTSTVDNFYNNSRLILMFNTTALPMDAVIISAKLELYIVTKKDDLNILPDICVYTVTPASFSSVVGADYDVSLYGGVALTNTLAYNDITEDAYNELNFIDFSGIIRRGITTLVCRTPSYDVPVISPAWSDSQESLVTLYTRQKAGDFKPKLTVEYYIDEPALPLGVPVKGEG
jgi:hypothetical protein